MNPAEITIVKDNVIIQARGSELLITADHVVALKNLKQPRDFTVYFMNEALVNRAARKLFEAWLRKDRDLWPRLYQNIQKHEISDETLKALSDRKAEEKAEKPAKAAPKDDEDEAPKEKKAKVAAGPKKEAKKVAEKEEVATTTKKAPAKAAAKPKSEPKEKKAASTDKKAPAKKKK